MAEIARRAFLGMAVALSGDVGRGQQTRSASDLLAESWDARGLLEGGRFEEADRRALDVAAGCAELLKTRKLDADADLPTALGAAIEVHARALTHRGARSESVFYLRDQLQAWKGTSTEARIQKNLNLLTLEGKPAPTLNVAEWVTPAQPRALVFKEHPVLLFFWAHWCADCKAEAPIIRSVWEKFGKSGLRVVGPTMRYGFAAGGEQASASREKLWIEETRSRYYAAIGPMPVFLSESSFRRYGVSTTPTLVLIDKNGIVRLYHPGAMSSGELDSAAAKWTV